MKAVRVAVVAVILAAAMNPGLAVDTPKPVVLKGHTKAVSAVAWAADGKAVATAGNDGTIRVWDPATGRQPASSTKIGPDGMAPGVAFAADLKVAAVNYGGYITIRTVADGKVLVKIDAILDRGQQSTFRQVVAALAFSPDGKRLATAGSAGGQGLPPGVLIVWDARTGKVVHKYDNISTTAGSVAWSPDGKTVAAGTAGVGGELPVAGEVWVWDAGNGKALHTFPVKPKVAQGEWAWAPDVAFSPDGKRVAAPVTVGGRGSSVRVWDLRTGKSTQPVKMLGESVNRLAFSPDGKYLATAWSDKVVRLWDVKTGKEVAALACPDEVTAVAFSPDGKSLATGGDGGSVRIWATPPAK